MNKLKFELRSLNDSLDLYRSIVDNNNIVAITNSSGVIVDVNEKFCEISGYSREELIGSTHKIVNSGHHDELFWKKMWKSILAGKEYKCEIKNKAKSGYFYWVETIILPIMNYNNEPEYFFSVRKVITERKYNYLADQEKIRKLEALNKQASELLHDLNNSLTVMICAANSIKKTGKIEQVSIIQNSFEDAALLTKTIKEAIKSYVKSDDVNIQNGEAFIEMMKGELTCCYESLGIEVEIKSPNKDFWWTLSRVELRRIIHNLFKNSAEAINRQANKKISLSIERGGCDPDILIRDSGYTPDESVCLNMFNDEFSTKDGTTNSGIGLYNVRSILEKKGFGIKVLEGEVNTTIKIFKVA